MWSHSFLISSTPVMNSFSYWENIRAKIHETIEWILTPCPFPRKSWCRFAAFLFLKCILLLFCLLAALLAFTVLVCILFVLMVATWRAMVYLTGIQLCSTSNVSSKCVSPVYAVIITLCVWMQLYIIGAAIVPSEYNEWIKAEERCLS